MQWLSGRTCCSTDDRRCCNTTFLKKPEATRPGILRADPSRRYPRGRSKGKNLLAGARGATNIADLPLEFLEFFGSMINMDNPHHGRLRRLVSAAFTPKQVARKGGSRE